VGIGAATGDAEATTVLGIVGTTVGALLVVLGIPGIVAGYGLLPLLLLLLALPVVSTGVEPAAPEAPLRRVVLNEIAWMGSTASPRSWGWSSSI